MTITPENTQEMYNKYKDTIDMMVTALKNMNMEDRSTFVHLIPQDILTLIIYRCMQIKQDLTWVPLK